MCDSNCVRFPLHDFHVKNVFIGFPWLLDGNEKKKQVSLPSYTFQQSGATCTKHSKESLRFQTRHNLINTIFLGFSSTDDGKASISTAMTKFLVCSSYNPLFLIRDKQILLHEAEDSCEKKV